MAERLEGQEGQEGRERQEGRAGWFRSLGSRVIATPARAAALASAAVLVLAVATVLLLFRPGFAPGGTAPGARAPAVTAPAAVPGAAPGSTPGTSGAPPVNANNPELVQSVEMELSQAEQHYEKAIAGLEQIAKAGEGTLDPQIAATLQKNLAVIDQAIQESRTALQSQPTSQLAQESLFEAFKRKVALLQDTIALINEMRKGNQAGAAKIMENMKRS